MAPNTSNLAPSALQRAVTLHRKGEYAKAELLYREVLALQPNLPVANHNLGAALAQQGNTAIALPFLKRALELDPSKPKYWIVYIQVLTTIGVFDEAIASYRRLIALQPKLIAAHYNLGNLLVQVGLKKEAAECFRMAVTLDPKFAPAHNNLGNLLKLDGELEQAELSYRAAISANHLSAESHANLGSVLEQFGRLEEAEACFRTVIALAPEHPDIDRSLGVVLAELGHTAEALSAFMRHASRSQSGRHEASPPSPHKEKHDAEQRAYLNNSSLEDLLIAGGERLADCVINPGIDATDCALTWRRSKPKLLIIDNLLTSDALSALQRLCLGSTFWRRSFPNGYLGALPETGFATPLLAQIGEELPMRFPEVFEKHPLLQLWAFKYDSQLAGINLHADFAAVNVNFWITPDIANLQPGRGGLIVWDKAAPLDWDFKKYNNDEHAMRAFLKSSGARAIVVPYRCNRAVIFDSDLFHETDSFHFREGYESRRINVTYLFGWRAAGARET